MGAKPTEDNASGQHAHVCVGWSIAAAFVVTLSWLLLAETAVAASWVDLLQGVVTEAIEGGKDAPEGDAGVVEGGQTSKEPQDRAS